MRQRLLVCDDEELIRWSICEHFRNAGFEVTEAVDGEDGLAKVMKSPQDLVVTDLKMPKMGGLEMLREIRCRGFQMPFIVLTAHGAVSSAVEATQLGATKYIGKPFDLDEVSDAVHAALESHRVSNGGTAGVLPVTKGYGHLIGNAPPMLALYDTLIPLRTVAAPTVMLTGASGTGKEVVAQTIHDNGPRATRPMVHVDCASLPDQLIESELFGHERGAFTDAKSTKKGMFEIAHGGTVLLDEIGEMTPSTQAKLLRVLESRTYRRVGGTVNLKFDASVIAATNRDLRNAVEQGTFREDLYFRLKVIHVHIPDLRERREDIQSLAEHFIRRFNKAYRKNVIEVSGEALRKLEAYAWPGNVRELRNVIERIIILGTSDRIGAEHLPPEIRYRQDQEAGVTAGTFQLPPEGIALEALEQSLLDQAMARTKGNQTQAARLLGISRYALRYRLEKYAKRKK